MDESMSLYIVQLSLINVTSQKPLAIYQLKNASFFDRISLVRSSYFGGIMDTIDFKEVLLSVYSIDYLLKCKVLEHTGDVAKIAPRSGRVDMFQVHDPVVLLIKRDNRLETIPADISEIDSKNGLVTAFLRLKEVDDERRVFERYPVSLAVSARKKFSNRRLHFLVKDISLYGMGAVSQADLEVDELIDIDLITDRSMFYFSGQVVWRNNLDGGYEYGLKLTNYDVATKHSFEEYLDKLNESYQNMIPKAR